ncbi:Hypothetical predicted protein [Podarcis lilfordi]|uniref:Retrotransposon gag domain-containing protein n=1 Tax=Podarcis lilfordi TaxID=74358 RepID=A0AA35PBZ2_9SAUR|nr:Hypothetical predicted protein [Podarcis lilfordi]
MSVVERDVQVDLYGNSILVSDNLGSEFKIGDLCGPDVRTAQALVAPLAVQAEPWDTIQEKLRNYYAQKPSKIAAHHAFYHRNQAEGESNNNYTTALRQAAMHCEFRDLDDALMDQIVCGVQDIRLQRHLLAKPDLTLQKAIEEAAASEAVELSAQETHKASRPYLKDYVVGHVTPLV